MYEVKYVQLKGQLRLRYTTSPCLKKGCIVPRNMSNNQGYAQCYLGVGKGEEEGSSR